MDGAYNEEIKLRVRVSEQVSDTDSRKCLMWL